MTRPAYQTDNEDFVANPTGDGYLEPVDETLRQGQEDDPASPVPPGGWQNEPAALPTGDATGLPEIDPATALGSEDEPDES